MAGSTATIDQLDSRDPLPDDQIEVQRPNGGPSARVAAAALGASKEAILAALGWDDVITTDTDITIVWRTLGDVQMFVTLPGTPAA